MPNTRNVQVSKELEEKKSRAKSIVLAEYTGLTSAQQTKLRSELRKVGGEIIVAKNTLIGRVIGKDALHQSLQGQTGAVFSYDDEVSALKVVVKFADETKVLTLKQGVIGDTVMSAKDLESLSKLPGKQELLGMLLGRLNAPASKLVGVLTASTRDLVFVLDAIAKKKESATA